MRILLTAVVILGVTIFSSTINLGCCPDPGVVAVSWQDISLSHINNQDIFAELDADTVFIPAEAYGILVSYSVKREYALKISYQPNTLYATECPEPRIIYTESVTSIKIVSTGSFDSSHPPGALLNDFFSVKSHYEYDTEEYSIDSLQQLMSNIRPPKTSSQLQLNMDRPEDSVHVFTISYELSDGRVLLDSTEVVVFAH